MARIQTYTDCVDRVHRVHETAARVGTGDAGTLRRTKSGSLVRSIIQTVPRIGQPVRLA